MEVNSKPLKITNRNVINSIVETIDSLIVVTPDSKIQLADSSTYRLLEYGEEELNGKPVNTIVILDDFPFEDEWIEYLIDAGVQKNMEMKYLSKNGIEVPMLVTSSVIKDNQNLAEGIVLTAKNIAQYKSIEQELRKAMTYTQNLIDSSMDMIVATNEHCEITEFNKAARDRYGFSLEEILGRDIKTIYNNPDEIKKFLEAASKYNKYRDEFISVDKENNMFPALATFSALRQEHGDIEGYMEIIRDMTDTKEADRYRRLLTKATETMQIGITITDIYGHIIYTNPSDASMHGHKADELIGQHVRIFAPKDAWSEMTVQKMLDLDRNRIWKRESVNVRKDGRTFPVYLMSDVIRDDKGKPIGVVTSCEDITKKKDMEKELKKYNEQLNKLVSERTSQLEKSNLLLQQEVGERKEAEEKLAKLLDELTHNQDQLVQSEKMASLGMLVAGIAHEINNPLGFVHSNLKNLNKFFKRITELIEYGDQLELPENIAKAIEVKKEEIQYDYLNGRIKKILERSGIGIDRIKKIILDLKTFSRLDAAEFSDADINNAIDTTLSILTHEYKGRIEIIKNYASLPQVRCNLSKLNQVFMNLLVNACHAIEGTGTITITTTEEKDMVIVDISDTGKGIPQEMLTQIFNPFFTTKPVGQGTGLGLSISYKIVEEHGGRISVNSTPGKGTTFIITIPLNSSIPL